MRIILPSQPHSVSPPGEAWMQLVRNSDSAGSMLRNSVRVSTRIWKAAAIWGVVIIVFSPILKGLATSHAPSGKLALLEHGAVLLALGAISLYARMGFWSRLAHFRKDESVALSGFVSGANRSFFNGLAAISIFVIISMATVALGFVAVVCVVGLMIVVNAPRIIVLGSAICIFLCIASLSIWLSLRLSLWAPTMFCEEVDAAEAIKRSFDYTDGNLLRVMCWIILPEIVAALLARQSHILLIGYIGIFMATLIFIISNIASLFLYESIRDGSGQWG